MQLQGDGLYTALLIKVFAYLLALRLQAQGGFWVCPTFYTQN